MEQLNFFFFFLNLFFQPLQNIVKIAVSMGSDCSKITTPCNTEPETLL